MKKRKGKKRIVASMDKWQSRISIKVRPDDPDNVRLIIRTDKHTVTINMSMTNFLSQIRTLHRDMREISQRIAARADSLKFKSSAIELALKSPD